MSVIRIQNLIKSYNGLRAVDDISFEVREGEFFAFLGPNGAGKTTTINILCTLLSPTSGVVEVAGHDCRRESSKVRAKIGLVFQETTLDNELTAYENLKFHGYLYNMKGRGVEDRIDSILEVVALHDRKNDIVKTFSGGMKRRLEIARGLLHAPRVLFLDEPTLGLDPQTRGHVWEFIGRLRREEGVTIFLTTHYMDEAEACDRVAVIDHGRIITCGRPADLKTRIKGDSIYIETSDDIQTQLELKELFSIDARSVKEGLAFTVDAGDIFIPKIFERLSTTILSVRIKKPTLEDVFIHLTGRELRDRNEGCVPVDAVTRRRRV